MKNRYFLAMLSVACACASMSAALILVGYHKALGARQYRQCVALNNELQKAIQSKRKEKDELFMRKESLKLYHDLWSPHREKAKDEECLVRSLMQDAARYNLLPKYDDESKMDIVDGAHQLQLELHGEFQNLLAWFTHVEQAYPILRFVSTQWISLSAGSIRVLCKIALPA